MEEKLIKKPKVIGCDEEFLEILEKLRIKVMKATWDGLDNISYKDLTKILAKKIKASKMV